MTKAIFALALGVLLGVGVFAEEPVTASGWLRKGMDDFRAGKISESAADFDKVVELAPERKAYLWQRGITLYYAGEFKKGREQFEAHQTVNPNDVENAVWHFLCVAKSEGFEEARRKLIAITGDSRVPMKEIHALFAGRQTPEKVLEAARAAADKEAIFYAYLYLGLFEEARNDAAKSLEYMSKAAGEFAQDHYMGDVARVHLRLRTDKNGAAHKTKE